MKTIAKQDLFINDENCVREVRLIGSEGEQWELSQFSEAAHENEIKTRCA